MVSVGFLFVRAFVFTAETQRTQRERGELQKKFMKFLCVLSASSAFLR